MFRFKLGFVLGLAVGWLVATGRAAELVDQLRARLDRSDPATSAPADAGVYDFAVRAAE